MVPIRKWIWVTQAHIQNSIILGFRMNIRLISSLRCSCQFPKLRSMWDGVPKKANPILFNKPILRTNSTNSFPPSVDEGSQTEALPEDVFDEPGAHSSISIRYRDIENDTDDPLSQLRVRLYEVDKDDCGTLLKLYDAASVQEVFDTIETAPEVNVKFSSQALVTLWDIQKFRNKLGPIFEPENDFINKEEFIKSISDHSTFTEKILRPILENHEELDDSALGASIMCLQRMNYPLLAFEPLIEECIKRKDSLDLPGLSRLSVCLRSENLYGQLVMSHFMPLITNYVDNMSTDMDFRLVSIMLKGMSRMLSENIINKYLSRVSSVVEKDCDFEIITHCKIFVLLTDMGHDAYNLLQKVGSALAPKVPDMELIEILNLQKFLGGPLQEPHQLIDALLKRTLRMIEEDGVVPRLDSLSAVAPYLKTIQHRKKLTIALKLYMDKSNFDLAIHVLFTILKSIRTNDAELYNQFWNNVLVSLEKLTEPKRVFTFAKNYLNFTHSLLYSYRHLWFETLIKRHLNSYLQKYISGEPDGFISPSDFSTLIAFLVAFDLHFVDVQNLAKLADFAPQMKAPDLYFIAKGVDLAMINVFYRKRVPTKKYETMIQICSIIEEECAHRLSKESKDLSNADLLMMSRVSTVANKVKGDSPLFDMATRQIIQNGINDSREVRELCHVLSTGNYYYPIAMEKISAFLIKNLDYISPETLERFLLLSYAVGWEQVDFPYEKLASIIERNWDKLGVAVIQTSVALAYNLHLTPMLVRNIFTVDFLDQIDEELSSSFGNATFYPVKLRVSLMELNRSVCIDMPDSNLPWFHDKFCQNVISQGRSRETYLQTEVFGVLSDLLGENAILSQVCLPKDYYYPIDFVIEFDEFSRPIRRKRKTSFFRDLKENSNKVSRKVAILILQPSAFTKNIRNLKGSFKLKQRHLEMLGYDVVKIDSYHWNSMYMSENLAKQNYLESQIFQ